MTTAEQPHVELDDAGEGRTTGALLGSLVARLQTLQLISGAQTIGSLVAGLARLGQDAARTAEGARVREALESTRIAANGATLWSTLGMDAAWSRFPPSPVLEDMRNDLALLLAVDLEPVIAEVDVIDPAIHVGPLREAAPIECLDLIVGMWAYSSEIVAVVEALTATAAVPEVRAPPVDGSDGPVLR